ncbi:MAG TPA: Na/Pi cotransporter family protein [Bacteroidales bacterium]|nr:Na/Pi cotransporter family protein [Bacteroidales bacterium]OQB70787.1 MAG: Na+/Pi-cotransporter [Bacteroidetes bacterium ADurb.Bin139]HOG25132.1 Na/Pi cotransporter family protein [Bacteroidales bacterium]HOR11706.1 Na/Pi cotransporter family protein [Bacteroidales bacterium]HOZ19432.1 Na/Pi cotransporter family protein [Bacteroidales bacterium]
MSTVLQILNLAGSLGLFLYGMTLMSESLQKIAGDRLRRILSSITSNPLKGVLTGLAITSIIQSSSATTVMVVSFVNAGLLTLAQAIGVIMGANIGTTVTAWIVSLLGFKADIAILAVPLIAVGFIMFMSKRQKRKHTGEMIIGFALLFLGLTFLKESVPDLSSSPDTLKFLQSFTGRGFGSVLIFVGVGTLLTMILQSSSATMALTLVMVNYGWIPFEIAAAMVLGENIGTTITANIAAAVGNVSAKRAALAHTFFNMIGVIWAVALFRPFLRLVGQIITGLGGADPFIPIAQAADPVASGNAMIYAISTLHTLFNVINTSLLIWFIPVLLKIVTFVIKSPKEEEKYRLKFIQAGLFSTAELSLNQVKQEIIHFGNIITRQYSIIRNALDVKDNDEFDTLFKKISYYEEVTDRIEFEIAEYLNQIGDVGLSSESGDRIQSMYKIIGEMESMGDSGYSLGRILQRKRINNVIFDERINRNIYGMMDLIDKGFEIMLLNLQEDNTRLHNIDSALDAEKDINKYRDMIREGNLLSLGKNEYDYLTGVYYMDLIAELERTGDYIINVSESIMETKS